MDFRLNEDEVLIYDMAKKFAMQHMLPNAKEWDEKKIFPKDVLRKTAELGFSGIYISEEFGGSNLGYVESILILSALSMGCPSTAAFLSIHNLVGGVLDKFASIEQKEKYLPDLLSMKNFGSFCLTEPSCGSDAAELRCKAELKGDKYIINGSKAFISGAGQSDILILFARTGEKGPKGISTLIVDANAKGISYGEQEKKIGWNSQPTAIINFDNVEVPKENLLGKEGDGFKFAMHSLNGGRLNIAACSLGAAEYALRESIKYAKDRKLFSEKLIDKQITQFKLAEMEIKLETGKNTLLKAGWAFDNNDAEKVILCSIAKKYVTDTCYEIIDQALQLHGGYGCLKDFPFERLLRDLRIHKVVEGTNEVMSIIIAKQLLAKYQN